MIKTDRFLPSLHFITLNQLKTSRKSPMNFFSYLIKKKQTKSNASEPRFYTAKLPTCFYPSSITYSPRGFYSQLNLSTNRTYSLIPFPIMKSSSKDYSDQNLNLNSSPPPPGTTQIHTDSNFILLNEVAIN